MTCPDRRSLAQGEWLRQSHLSADGCTAFRLFSVLFWKEGEAKGNDAKRKETKVGHVKYINFINSNVRQFAVYAVGNEHSLLLVLLKNEKMI